MGRATSNQHGSDTLIQPARPRVVALTLAKHAGLSPVLFGPPLSVALLELQWSLASALALPVAFSLIVLAMTWRKPLPRDLRAIEAMVSLALLFLLSALFSVPAFQVLGLHPVSALFEGVSAITTTGLSMASDAESWPFAAHVLRSWMQWCGGLVMATAVIALILSPGRASAKLGRVGLDENDRIQSTRAQARDLLGVYVGISLLFSVPIILFVGDWQEGIVLTLAAISTGGFAPLNDSLASYGLGAQISVITASVAGAISLLTFSLMVRGKWHQAFQLGSVQRVLGMLLLGMLVIGVAAWFRGHDPVDAFLNLSSALSTAGFSVSAMPTDPVLIILMIAVMIIGGDVGSTAGGIKIARVLTLGRTLRHALTLPRLPDRAVAPLREAGKPVANGQLVALLALVFVYAISALLVWTILMALGAPALPALFDTVSALSTIGLSAEAIGPHLSLAAQAVLIFAMIAGRLEFIAVLLLISPRTWIHRS